MGVYLPIRGEPDLGPAYEELSARGVRLALPVVDERDAPLRFLAWRPGDALAADLLGMQAPACATEVRPDALLIPCVGFNAGNVRLGYGGGFYDRTLAQLPRPAAIGIAYAAALADFAAAPHDVPLDRVITERSPTDA